MKLKHRIVSAAICAITIPSTLFALVVDIDNTTDEPLYINGPQPVFVSPHTQSMFDLKITPVTKICINECDKTEHKFTLSGAPGGYRINYVNGYSNWDFGRLAKDNELKLKIEQSPNQQYVVIVNYRWELMDNISF